MSDCNTTALNSPRVASYTAHLDMLIWKIRNIIVLISDYFRLFGWGLTSVGSVMNQQDRQRKSPKELIFELLFSWTRECYGTSDEWKIVLLHQDLMLYMWISCRWILPPQLDTSKVFCTNHVSVISGWAYNLLLLLFTGFKIYCAMKLPCIYILNLKSF